MSEIRVDSIGNESNTGGPVLSGITEFSGQQYFIPPRGTTAERPSDCPPGSIRFNTDSAHLEYWNGLVWLEFEASSVEIGNQLLTSGNSAGGTGVRGVFIGNRNNPTFTSSPKSEYISLSTLGNAVDFGSLTQQVSLNGAFSSSTRGVFFGGYNHPVAPSRTNRIAGCTFASTGSHVDFSSTVSTNCQSAQGLSNQTRGLCFIGNPFPASGLTNTIEHVTIASIGNAVNFGDLVDGIASGLTFGSSVRGVYAGGYQPSYINTIQYVTISTTGDAQDFGDLTELCIGGSGGGNATRGIRMAGRPSDPAGVNTIDYVTIASTGNAQDFGDLLRGTQNGCQANISSPLRSIYAGGNQSSNENCIQFITIATTGNSLDFGDLTEVKFQFSGASNGHGGL
jgi:hypothetical protein|tara:strand:- start:42 stop:1226 length:1185 start_codon:yes stop_codon:yes gene_type:complete